MQTDFGLGVLGSGERTHFRSLSKRSRARIEASVDRRNDHTVKEAHNEIKKLKTQMTKETSAHRYRCEKSAAQGTEALKQAKGEHELQLHFWQNKCDELVNKKAEVYQQHKDTITKLQDKHKQHEVKILLLSWAHCVNQFFMSLPSSIKHKRGTLLSSNH